MTPKYSANAVRLKGTESELQQLIHSKEHVHALRNTRNDLVVHQSLQAGELLPPAK